MRHLILFCSLVLLFYTGCSKNVKQEGEKANSSGEKETAVSEKQMQPNFGEGWWRGVIPAYGLQLATTKVPVKKSLFYVYLTNGAIGVIHSQKGFSFLGNGTYTLAPGSNIKTGSISSRPKDKKGEESPYDFTYKQDASGKYSVTLVGDLGQPSVKLTKLPVFKNQDDFQNALLNDVANTLLR